MAYCPCDVTLKMEDMEWSVEEESSVTIGEKTTGITFHSRLNTLLAVTSDSCVKILDLQSGVTLQKSSLSDCNSSAKQNPLVCEFLNKTNQLFVTQGAHVGLRKEHNGILLLDSALQTTIQADSDVVLVEMPHAEAKLLLQYMKSTKSTDSWKKVIEALEDGLKKCKLPNDQAYHRFTKWATVRVWLPQFDFHNVADNIVKELMLGYQNIPELSVTAALMDRLKRLLPESVPLWLGSTNTDESRRVVNRSLMFSEVARRETFDLWPHMDYKWAHPDAMAQAGFYHQPVSPGDDRALCFTCHVCLVCWEPTDEPWSEHERHSSNCPYVQGGATQNVPLSSTLATAPAQKHGDGKEPITCVSSTTCPHLIATSTRHGHICVWDVSDQLTLACELVIKEEDIKHTGSKKSKPKNPLGEVLEAWGEKTEGQQKAHKDKNSDPEEDGDDEPPLELFGKIIISEKEPTGDELPSNRTVEGSQTENGADLTSPLPPNPDETSSIVQASLPLANDVGHLPPNLDPSPPVVGPSSDILGPPPLPPVRQDVSKAIHVTSMHVCKPSKPLQESAVSSVIKEYALLVVGISYKGSVKENSKDAEEETLLSGAGISEDEAGIGVDVSEREDEFADNLMGDEVDNRTSSEWKHCLLVYKLQTLPNNILPAILTEISKEKALLQAQDPLLNVVMKKTGGTSASSTNTPMVPDNYLDYVFMDVDESAGTAPGPSYFSSCIGKNKKQLQSELDQCLMLPSGVQGDHLNISSINFCRGSNSFLVVVLSPKSEETSSCNNVNDSATVSSGADGKESVRDRRSCGGALLAYAVGDREDLDFVENTPKYMETVTSDSDAVVKLIPLSPRRKESVRSEDGEADGPQSAISSRIEEDQFDRSSDAAEEDEPDFGSSLGSSFSVLAVLRARGSIDLLNIHQFEQLCTYSYKGNAGSTDNSSRKFVDLAYCHGMDRLCAVTEEGRASILVVHDSSEGRERMGDTTRVTGAASSLAADSVDAHLDSKKKEDLFIGRGSLTHETLVHLHELTQFKTLVPRFKATVPPNWNEIHQEQQQRRHPQHLHQRNEDASQHTRTWKLQPDGLSWKEHLIELLLTRTSIGHVDIKFNLQPTSQPPPKIQVALLRQTEKKHNTPVDAQIDFRMESRHSEKGATRKTTHQDPMAVFANPFNDFSGTDEADGGSSKAPFLELHKKDIVCGPCILESFAGMRSNSGSVSLTSRELMASRDRSFLLYIGILEDRGEEGKQEDAGNESQEDELMSRLLNSHPPIGSEKLTMNAQKTQLRGCEMIQKVSITIRRTKKLSATLPRGDRFQRGVMLENKEFHRKLFRTVVCEEVSDLTPQNQRLALDILTWIAGVQNCEAPNRKASIIPILMEYNFVLIRCCYVEGDRCIAHKCSQLIAQCLGCAKKAEDEKDLKKCILYSILEWMPKIPHFTSAGALSWFFRILYLVMPVDEVAVSKKCLSQLMEASRLLDEKTLKDHAFLRTSFGLYGTPLDPILFETHPDLPKQENSETVNPVSSGNLWGYSVPSYTDITPETSSQKGLYYQSSTEQDWGEEGLLDVASMEEGALSFLEGGYFMNGLLEVEPLHFTCCATSDGTQVVKDDQATPAPPSKTTPAYSQMTAPSMVPKPTTTQQVVPPMFSLSSLTSAMASVEQQIFANIATIKQLKQSDSQKSSQPPTPKNTPFFMTPPLSPPYETLWSPVPTSTIPEDLMSVLNGTIDHGKGDDMGSSSTISASSTILQNLVSPPELYSMMVERMHAGARRYAVLDFGHPVLLTDVFFPACKDLGSVTIDVWTKGGNLDGRRLAVSLDISNLNLVLNDLLDPPVCRFVKITVIGRYGINTARSKIPLGSYYGHSVALPSDSLSGPIHDAETSLALSVISPVHVDQFLLAVSSILEDVHCRYSLACSQLTSTLRSVKHERALQSWDRSLPYYSPSIKNRPESVGKVYSECVKLQKQLVVVQRIVTRLQTARRGQLPRSTLNSHRTHSLQNMSADALRVLCQHLLDTILASSDKSLPQGLFKEMDLETSKMLFKHICLKGTPDLRSKAGSVLLKGGSMQPWWGEFLAWVLTEFFQSNYREMFPQESVFTLLVSLGQRSLTSKNAGSLVSHLLTLLAVQLKPLKESSSQSSVGTFDLWLVMWTLLFLSCLLDAAPSSADPEKGLDKGDRWSYLSNSPQSMDAPSGNNFKSNGASAAQMQARFKKQLELHQAKLSSLKNLLKTWKSKMESKNQHWDFQFKKEIHHQASRHVRDIERLQRLTQKVKSADKKNAALLRNSGQKTVNPVKLPRGPSLQVARGLLHFLLAMDFTCHVDLFIVTCKVLAKVASSTVKPITLGEIATEEQLLQLLESCVGSGNPSLHGTPRGPWAFHAVSCLLADILEGENIQQSPPPPSEEEGAVGGQDEDMPSLEDERSPPVAEGSKESELSGEVGVNDETSTLLGEDMEPPGVPPPPLPIDPADLFASGGLAYDLDYLPADISTFPDPVFNSDFTFGTTKHSSNPNIVYQFGPPFTSTSLKQALMDQANMTEKQLPSKQIAGNHQKKMENGEGTGVGVPKVSSGMDARLEVGLDLGAEWFLRIHHLHQSLVIAQSFVSVQDGGEEECGVTGDVEVEEGRGVDQRSVVDSKVLLQQCFQKIFSGLLGGCYSVENTLKMWLQLSAMTESGQPMEVVFSSSGTTPRIPMTPAACKSLVSAIVMLGHVPSIAWCLLFHTLTLVLNQPSTSGTGGQDPGAAADGLISDPNLHLVMVKFLSQGGALDVFGASNQSQVGPTITEAFCNFLSCLFLKSPMTVSQKLLKLIKVLVEPSGAIYSCFGPMDAQVKLINFMVDKDVLPVDSDNVLSIAKHVSLLVSHHLSNPSRVALQSVGESSLNSKLVELIDKTPKAKAGQTIILAADGSRDTLLGLLLQFLSKMLTSELDLPSSRSLEGRMERMQLNPGITSRAMTDTGKLEAHQQGLPGYASDSIMGVPLSDDDKERSGEFMQRASPLVQSSSSSNHQRPASFRIVDLVLSSQETMSSLLSSLSQAASGDALGVVTSVDSQLYQLLMAISREALSEKMVGCSILSYVKDQQQRTSSHISEPLLWFLRSVLSNNEAFAAFCEFGGIQILCSNLVRSSQVTIDSSLSLVSGILAVMGKRRSAPAKTPSQTKKVQESKKQFGLVNFAPFCTVTSGNLNTTHPESLLHHTTSVRRSRTAWSYHFYPNETWYDMAINLPCAVLLEEVHVNLSSTSVGRCPSAVVLEVSSDGVIFAPVCSPVTISSLVTIRLSLSRPEVVQAVTIRLKKPVDSSVMNLSGIKVLGHPVFEMSNAKASQLVLDSVQTSVRWLRLLQHCLTISPIQDLPQNVMSVAAQAPGLLATCTTLLTIPQGYPYRGDIESVLMRLGLSSSEVGLTILDMLLRNSIPGSEADSSSVLVTQLCCKASLSTVDIIAQLGLTPDSGARDRVQALLDWLGDTARVALHSHSSYSRAPHTLSPTEVGLLHPASTHVHCVAAVIWAAQTQGVKIDLSGVLTKELFSSVYEWSMVLPFHSPLKRAVDYVLCAMCQVQPAFYDSLLVWMGIQWTSGSSMEGSMTDDNKEDELNTSQLTDDSKGAALYLGLEDGSHLPEEWGHLVIDEAHLATLAVASQSPGAVQRLIQSGFLTRLAEALADFCTQEIIRTDMPLSGDLLTDSSKAKARLADSRNSPRSPLSSSRNSSHESLSAENFHITADLVTPVLNFFTKLSNEPSVKNWLGSPEGSVFWSPMLTVLCHFNRLSLLLNLSTPSHRRGRVLTIAQYGAIENAALDFFSKCIVCHSSNQKLLAQNICDELCGRDDIPHKKGLSGFLRRLLLRLMLEDESITLALSSSCYLQRSSSVDAEQISHPRFGVGKKNMVLDVRLCSSSKELLSKVTESSLSDPQTELEKIDKLAKSGESANSDTSPYVMVHIGPDKKSVFETELQESFGASGISKSGVSDVKRKAKLGKTKHSRSGKEGASSESKTVGSSQTVQVACPTLGLSHPYLKGMTIPGAMTLGQIVMALRQHGMEEGFSTLQFGVMFQSPKSSKSKTDSSKSLHAQENSNHHSLGDNNIQETLMDTPTVPSFLQVFAGLGGLALLAEHLPHAYHQMAFDQSSWQSLNKEFNSSLAGRKIEEDIFGDDSKEDEISENSSIPLLSGLTHVAKKDNQAVKPMLTPSVPATVPPHSLAAFGLFLRLPGYAEVLLKEQKKARYLLRLMLGVTEDKDGNNILSMPESNTLPTLPFTALITLLNHTPLATDDGVVLRRMSLETGSIHLILACLAVLSHQSPIKGETNPFPELSSAKAPTAAGLGTESGIKDQKAQSYWAKGTGFGTGSTVSGWNAEEALKRQRAEEEHVTCLFRVLSGYMHPHDWDNETTLVEASADLSEEQQESIFPAVLVELLRQSCLLPAISSYLRNDSVLDMAQHVPLYCSVLEILRALAVCPSLSSLLIHQDEAPATTSDVVLLNLLETMKNCVDVYNSKLGNGSKAKKDKRKNSRRIKPSTKMEEDTEEKETEGLAQLVPEINKTLDLVKVTVERLMREKNGGVDGKDGDNLSDISNGATSNHSKDDQYVAIMKKLQFDTFEMITEDTDGKIKFNLSHHFASRVQSAGNIKNAARARRLAQEAVTLSTSLPLSASSSVFVRCDDDRLDVMKVLITGPSETPYSLGCFEFDVFFPSDYPKSPMLVNLETTGQHSVRFNPNLYNDGKVCLSVLNTWHGRPEEKWNGDTSSFLQVLVSIQSLILVAEPYFNEPGYERSRGTVSGTKSSREYDANIMQATVKWGMLEMLRHPPACFKEVIQTHFYLKKEEVLRQCDSWIKQLTLFCNDKRVGRTVTHHLAALKRHTAHLQDELRSLQPPESLKGEMGGDSPPPPQEAKDSSASKMESTSQPSGPVDEAGTGAAANSSVDEGIALVVDEAGTGAVLNDIDNIGLMELPMLLDSTEELSDEYDWDDEEDAMLIT